MSPDYFSDAGSRWYLDLLEHHYADAELFALSLVKQADSDQDGCRVTPTASPRKVRYRGRQDRAYRFVYCILNRYAALSKEVVRHRCHNRRCINPDHLVIGTRWDNRQDDYALRDNGVDFSLL